MGLAGSPHCAVMCGAACAGVTQGRAPARLSFHAGRLLSYALGGAVAAASVSVMAQLAAASAALRPFWVLLHLAVLLLGLSLLWRGRQPAWMMGMGQQLAPGGVATGGVATVRWMPRSAPLRSGVAGLAWIAWPCGLLQSALVLAALASTPAWGAAVMSAFALTSSLGLLLGPALLWRLLGVKDAALGMVWAIRVAGLALVLSSAWALGHGVWAQIAAFCSQAF